MKSSNIQQLNINWSKNMPEDILTSKFDQHWTWKLSSYETNRVSFDYKFDIWIFSIPCGYRPFLMMSCSRWLILYKEFLDFRTFVSHNWALQNTWEKCARYPAPAHRNWQRQKPTPANPYTIWWTHNFKIFSSE